MLPAAYLVSFQIQNPPASSPDAVYQRFANSTDSTKNRLLLCFSLTFLRVPSRIQKHPTFSTFSFTDGGKNSRKKHKTSWFFNASRQFSRSTQWTKLSVLIAGHLLSAPEKLHTEYKKLISVSTGLRRLPRLIESSETFYFLYSPASLAGCWRPTWSRKPARVSLVFCSSPHLTRYRRRLLFFTGSFINARSLHN